MRGAWCACVYVCGRRCRTCDEHELRPVRALPLALRSADAAAATDACDLA